MKIQSGFQYPIILDFTLSFLFLIFSFYFCKAVGYFPHVAGTQRNDNILMPYCLLEMRAELRRGRRVFRLARKKTIDESHEILRGYAPMLLARAAVDGENHHLVGRIETLREIRQERLGTGERMRMKDDAQTPLGIQLAECLECRLDLFRMMGIIVIDERSVAFTDIFETPFGS